MRMHSGRAKALSKSEGETLYNLLRRLLVSNAVTMTGSPQLVDGIIALGSVSLLEILLLRVPNGELCGAVAILFSVCMPVCMSRFDCGCAPS